MVVQHAALRVGILGKANIALRSVIPAIQKLPKDYQVVGIATRTKTDDDWSGIPIIEGYDALLNKDLIDAVYIPLPNAMHYEWVKIALSRGIHVLVEKSLACTLDEVTELNKCADEHQVVLLENFQFTRHGQLAYIKNLIHDGVLGELRILRSTFCFPPFADADNIRYQKELGGGALLDAGAYPVKLAQIILGPDVSVTAASLSYDETSGVDIWGGAFLQKKNSPLFAQIAFGFDHYYQCNVEVVGTKGKLYTNRLFTAHDGVQPVVIVETADKGVQEITLEKDDHFSNMLLYFRSLTHDAAQRQQEYLNNINQSRLLEELRKIAHD